MALAFSNEWIGRNHYASQAPKCELLHGTFLVLFPRLVIVSYRLRQLSTLTNRRSNRPSKALRRPLGGYELGHSQGRVEGFVYFLEIVVECLTANGIDYFRVNSFLGPGLLVCDVPDVEQILLCC